MEVPSLRLPKLIDSPSYFGPERRSRPRLALDEMSTDDAEQALQDYVREMPPEDLNQDPETWWQRALEVLDLPRNTVANLIAGLTGIKGSSKERFAGMQKIYGSDILKGLGLSTGSKIGNFLTGLTADVLTDPLTYLGGAGLVGKGVSVGGKVLKGAAATAARLAEHAPEAVRLAKIAEAADTGGAVRRMAAGTTSDAAREFLQGLGLKTPEALEEAASVAKAADSGLSLDRIAADVADEAGQTYGGRFGLGIGTGPLRELPAAAVVTAPAQVVTALFGAGAKAAGRGLRSVPLVGAGLEAAGDAGLAAARGLGWLTEHSGRPFSWLPDVGIYKPFAEMPIIGPAAKALEEKLPDLAARASEVKNAILGRTEADARMQDLAEPTLQQAAADKRREAQRQQVLLQRAAHLAAAIGAPAKAVRLATQDVIEAGPLIADLVQQGRKEQAGEMLLDLYRNRLGPKHADKAEQLLSPEAREYFGLGGEAAVINPGDIGSNKASAVAGDLVGVDLLPSEPAPSRTPAQSLEDFARTRGVQIPSGMTYAEHVGAQITQAGTQAKGVRQVPDLTQFKRIRSEYSAAIAAGEIPMRDLVPEAGKMVADQVGSAADLVQPGKEVLLGQATQGQEEGLLTQTSAAAGQAGGLPAGNIPVSSPPAAGGPADAVRQTGLAIGQARKDLGYKDIIENDVPYLKLLRRYDEAQAAGQDTADLYNQIQAHRRAQKYKDPFPLSTDYLDQIDTYQAARRREAAARGRVTAAEKDQVRAVALDQAKEGVVTPEAVTYAPLHQMPAELKKAIQAEAQYQLAQATSDSTRQALERIIHDAGEDVGAAVEGQKQRLVNILTGQTDQRSIMVRQEGWEQARPADPIVTLYVEPQWSEGSGTRLVPRSAASRQAAIDASIESVKAGRPDELASAALARLDPTLQKPLVAMSEDLQDFLRTLGNTRPPKPQWRVVPPTAEHQRLWEQLDGVVARNIMDKGEADLFCEGLALVPEANIRQMDLGIGDESIRGRKAHLRVVRRGPMQDLHGLIEVLRQGTGRETIKAVDLWHEVGHYVHNLVLDEGQWRQAKDLIGALPPETLKQLFPNTGEFLQNYLTGQATDSQLLGIYRDAQMSKVQQRAAIARYRQDWTRETFAHLFAGYIQGKVQPPPEMQGFFDRAVAFVQDAWRRISGQTDIRKDLRPYFEQFTGPLVAPGPAEALTGGTGMRELQPNVQGLRDAVQRAWSDPARAGGNTPAEILSHLVSKASGLTWQQRQDLFGVKNLKLLNRDGRFKWAAEAAVQEALSAIGKAAPGMPGELAGMGEEAFLRLLQISRGERVANSHTHWMFTRGAITQPDPNEPWQLTETGRRAVAWYGQNLLGREPNAESRIRAEIEDLVRRYHETKAKGLPADRAAMAQISRKNEILANMGKPATETLKGLDQVDLDLAEKAAAPSTPDYLQYLSPELRSIVHDYEGSLAVGLARERAAGLATPELSTQRNLGYVPRVLTDPKGIGGLVRGLGMSLDASVARMQGLDSQVLNAMNKARAASGLPSLKASDMEVQAVVDVLMQGKMAPQHESQLMRVMARENTTRELEDLLRQAGEGKRVDVGLFKDPMDSWLIRRYRTIDSLAAVDIVKKAATSFGKPLRAGESLEAGWHRGVDVPGLGTLLKDVAFKDADAAALAKVLHTYQRPSAIMKAWDKITSVWKTMVLSVPSYTVANAWSDGFMMLAGDMFDPAAIDDAWRGVRDYHTAVKAIRGAGLDERAMLEAVQQAKDPKVVEAFKLLSRPIEGTGFTTGQLIDKLHYDHGYIGSGLYGQEMEAAVRDLHTDPMNWDPGAAWKKGWKEGVGEGPLWKKVARFFKPTPGNPLFSSYTGWFRAVNTAAEDHRHLAAVIARLRQGDTLDQAVGRAKQFLFDYGDLSDFEKNVMKRIFPFWAWIRNNTKVMFYMGMAKPQFLNLMTKMRGDLEASLVDEGEVLAPSLRPKHIRGEFGVQVSGGLHPQFVNMGRMYPLKELGLTPLGIAASAGASLGQAGVESFNPFAKAAIESTINRDLYWDRPITAYPGQQSQFLGLNVSPAVKRALRMIRPLNVVEQASWQTNTPGTGAFTAAGFRTFPVDVHRQIVERDREIGDQAGRAKADLRRALYRGDAAEADRLAQIYQQLHERLSKLSSSKFYKALQSPERQRRSAEVEQQLGAVLAGG